VTARPRLDQVVIAALSPADMEATQSRGTWTWKSHTWMWASAVGKRTRWSG
jgi:hypothetical protein